jgi:hypothetical protein
MRLDRALLCLPFFYGALIVPIHGADSCSSNNPRTDFYPLVRLESTSRFFDDEAAFLFVGELGEDLNRANATFGFLTSCGHHFKIGGEILNQNIKYKFPTKNDKGWVRQHAVGGVYQATFSGCEGIMKSVDVGAQYSEVSRYRIHDFYEDHDENHRHDDHDKHDHASHKNREIYNRTVAGSRAYAFSAGLATAPWQGAILTGAVVYDKVDYLLKFSKNKNVQGVGGTGYYEQQISFDTSVILKAEIRAPYNYFEGKLKWGTTFYYGDINLALYGGWTRGKKGLPDITVAGVEIGFDYGLSYYSNKSSVGVCGDSPYAGRSTWGESEYYLDWLSKPAVYIPEVLAISEQRLIVPPEKPLHHSRHHHRNGKHKECKCLKNVVSDEDSLLINDRSQPERDLISVEDPYN